MSRSFMFRTTNAILSELGSSSSRLPGLLTSEFQATNVLFVTDPAINRIGLRSSNAHSYTSGRVCAHVCVLSLGLLDEPIAAARKAGLTVSVFDQVQEDPAESVVLAAVQAAKDSNAQAAFPRACCFIAIQGGG